MKLVISGYGRMGKEVEQVALQRQHTIVAIVDSVADFKQQIDRIRTAEVAIDFSFPEAAADNILRFFDENIPVVVGTTGWQERLPEIETRCKSEGKALLWGNNLSLGVNLFFQLNQRLAALMHPYSDYRPTIEETHHIHKKDAPSGTAITLANDILNTYTELENWRLSDNQLVDNQLNIHSIREGEVVGEHQICYHSDIDEIVIKHTAFNRKGFALGAVVAAEWLRGKQGVFGMKDLLNS